MRILRILTVFIILTLSSVFAFAQMTEDQARTKFSAADELYKKEDFAGAVAMYEEIRQSGWENGPLYYNLGNSYVKIKQIGRAVLNYERAKRFIPRDADVLSNARYAESLIGGGAQGPQMSAWEDFIQRQIDFYTLDELLWIVVGTGILGAAIFLIGLYGQWPGRRRFAVLSAFFVVLLIYAGYFYLKLGYQKDLCVMVDSAEGRYEPLPEATVYFQLFAGDRVHAVAAQGAWAKIRRSDGRSAWVPQDRLERIE